MCLISVSRCFLPILASLTCTDGSMSHHYLWCQQLHLRLLMLAFLTCTDDSVSLHYFWRQQLYFHLLQQFNGLLPHTSTDIRPIFFSYPKVSAPCMPFSHALMAACHFTTSSVSNSTFTCCSNPSASSHTLQQTYVLAFRQPHSTRPNRARLTYGTLLASMTGASLKIALKTSYNLGNLAQALVKAAAAVLGMPLFTCTDDCTSAPSY